MKIILLIVFLAIGESAGFPLLYPLLWRPEIGFLFRFIRGTSAARIRRVAEGDPIPTEDASFFVTISFAGWRQCSGTLITKDRVLSAGRCVVDENANLRLGLLVVMAEDLREAHTASRQVVHVELSHSVTGAQTRDMSIAVLFLAEPVSSYENVAPIALPTEDVFDAGRLGSSAPLTAQLIGTTTVLYPFPDQPIHRLDVLVERCELPNAFCGTAANGRITFGDEGSPLVHNGRLIGIALDRESNDERDLYVDVHKYLKFIHQWL